MKRKIRLTEQDMHRIVKETVNRLLRENTDDDELWDELEAAGATGNATPEQIAGWEEDLWINLNKTFQNANYLFNKTRDKRYARISEALSEAFALFPEDASSKYMQIDYNPNDGYGG